MKIYLALAGFLLVVTYVSSAVTSRAGCDGVANCKSCLGRELRCVGCAAAQVLSKDQKRCIGKLNSLSSVIPDLSYKTFSQIVLKTVLNVT